MLFLNASLRKCRKELAGIRAAENRLRSEDDDVQMHLGDLFDSVRLEMDSYIENEYSAAVWNSFAKKKPALIRAQTGETVRWEEVFPGEWEELLPAQKHALVGLIEGGGEYRFR